MKHAAARVQTCHLVEHLEGFTTNGEVLDQVCSIVSLVSVDGKYDLKCVA